MGCIFYLALLSKQCHKHIFLIGESSVQLVWLKLRPKLDENEGFLVLVF